jgi:hypothetical protein
MLPKWYLVPPNQQPRAEERLGIDINEIFKMETHHCSIYEKIRLIGPVSHSDLILNFYMSSSSSSFSSSSSPPPPTFPITLW